MLALTDHPQDLTLGATRRYASAAHLMSLPTCVCSQETPSELAAALPQLTELDLTANLIHTWSFVVDLCSALPQLSVLNLTGNHLHLQQLPCQPPLLTTLRGLVLNECGVTWQQVGALQLRWNSAANCIAVRHPASTVDACNSRPLSGAC
jgi:hypothetical protein